MRTFVDHLFSSRGNLSKARISCSRERGWRGDERYEHFRVCRPENGTRVCWPCDRAGRQPGDGAALSCEVSEAVLSWYDQVLSDPKSSAQDRWVANTVLGRPAGPCPFNFARAK